MLVKFFSCQRNEVFESFPKQETYGMHSFNRSGHLGEGERFHCDHAVKIPNPVSL